MNVRQRDIGFDTIYHCLLVRRAGSLRCGLIETERRQSRLIVQYIDNRNQVLLLPLGKERWILSMIIDGVVTNLTNPDGFSRSVCCSCWST